MCFFLINEKEGDILNTQDVTRSVIRLELVRAFRGMESNPKRTLRKLADLGKVCARGSVQKEIFGIFQQCLRYKDSPYFSVMQNLVRNVSAENLTTFGMNLGYNSWTDGAKKIRAKKDNEGILTSWIQILDLSQSEWTVENLNAFIDFWKTYGVCTYAFLPSASFSENTFLPEVFQKQNDCAFLWFLSDVDSFCIHMDDYKDVQNVMPIFKMEALMESEIHQILSAHKKLYGVYQLYNEQNIRECISRKSLGLLSSLGTPFLFFLSEDRKSDTSSVASRFAVDTRMKQAYPFLAVDFYSDITRINEIISGDPLPIHITERMNRLISSV